MSEERDWAEFYRAHKDDPEMWGEPEEDAPPARPGALSATITVRFSPDEAADLRELAEEMGATYSEIVRLAVRKFVHLRLAPAREERAEREEAHDLSLTNGTTSTASLSVAAHG